jgi:hypothetical protein
MSMGMHTGGRRFRRGLVALAACLATLSVSLVPPAGAASAPKFLGPVVSRAETPTVTLGRDGGYSVPLPNGKGLWIFADTPRFEYRQGAWRFRSFIPGSTAATMPFTPGKPPTGKLTEIKLGKRPPSSANPAQFLPTPPGVYMPNGSGKKCNKANGQPSTNPVRWPIGAAPMPDKTNVLVTYVVVCLVNSYFFTGEGWGFALYNWKTNRFTQAPYDVFRPKKDGSKLRSDFYFGSPIISGNKVAFFSWKCCGAEGGVFRTTVDLKVAALKKPGSYSPKRVPNVPATYDLSVAARSKTHSRYSMYNLRGDKGQYEIYTASAPSGPWKKVASGTLPRCNKSPFPCHSIILHPELSPKGRLLVSYHLPGYGPAIAKKHPYPKEPLRHVVMASVPCNSC